MTATRPIHRVGLRHFRTTPERAIRWFQAASQRMRRRTRVSGGSYVEIGPVDHYGAYPLGCVFSVEDCGPGTYGHPRYTLSATFDYS